MRIWTRQGYRTARLFSKNTKKVNDVMKDYKLLSYKLTHRDVAITMKQILEKNA